MPNLYAYEVTSYDMSIFGINFYVSYMSYRLIGSPSEKIHLMLPNDLDTTLSNSNINIFGVMLVVAKSSVNVQLCKILGTNPKVTKQYQLNNIISKQQPSVC